MIKRMLRSYYGLAMLFLLPLALIAVLGLVIGDTVDAIGLPLMATIGPSIIFTIQLFSGKYTLESIREDLLSDRKWRMYTLPHHPRVHVYATVLSSTVFCALQGLFLALFTKWAYGVNWGNLSLVFVLLIFLSGFIQLLHLVIALATRSDRLADRIGETYGIIAAILAARARIPLQDPGILRTIIGYLNPLEVTLKAVSAVMRGENGPPFYLALVILGLGSILLAFTSSLLGRRRLA